MSDDRTLAPAWIVVIVLSVVVAAQSTYIFMRLRGGRGGRAAPSSDDRRRTEWYNLASREPTVNRHATTGYSPIEPPMARFGRRY